MRGKSKFRLIRKRAGEEYNVLEGWILTDLIEDWRECLKKHAPELTLFTKKEGEE